MRVYSGGLEKAIADFRAGECGTAAVLYALAIIPVLMLTSFAVDSSRMITAERHLQSAIDAASLAGARALEDSSKTDADVAAIAQLSYQQNILTVHDDLGCATANIDVDRVAARVEVDATCTMPTLFGGSFWREDVDIRNVSTAQASVTKLDLALMLDVSGSMGGQKLIDLKIAAKDAAATLITPQTGDRVRISFNTYSTSVNAGIYAPAVLEHGGEPGVSDCVSERQGVAAWRDDAPGNSKWMGKDATSCPSSSVLPLTNDLAKFNSEIDAIDADGYTAGHLGVAWAWYLISPDWDSIWPAASKPHPYAEPNGKKAVILMTDGKFNKAYAGGHGNSNVQAKKMCEKMRDEGVIVYAVAFQAPSSAKTVLKDCTGDDSRFFDADNGAELKAAYAAIASELSNLALVG